MDYPICESCGRMHPPIRRIIEFQDTGNKREIMFNGETAVKASLRLTNGRSKTLVASRLYIGWNNKEAFTIPINKRIWTNTK